MKKRTLFLAMTALMITMTSGGSLTSVYADEIPTEAAETSESTELPIKPLTAKIVDENPYMAKSDSNIHHDCYNTEHIYERGVSVWLHKPPVNQAIYQLKYHNQRYVAKYFAQEICIKYAEEIRRWRPQALVPVPLHRKRRRKRGYNQAELLAEEIGKILGIPVVANLVKRVHYTGYQKKLDPIGRKKNLEHAFAPGGDPDRLPTDFRRVIIIDDIYTTGNTVDQVAKVLKTMGLQKVYFLTISIGQGY